MARCRFSFEDGTSAFGCRAYMLGEDPSRAEPIAAPTDFSRFIAHELNRVPGRYRSRGGINSWPPLNSSLRDFKRQWPHVAGPDGARGAVSDTRAVQGRRDTLPVP